MLEKLLGSKTRAKLLKLFLIEANTPYYIREISRKLNLHINSVRRELENLKHLGIVREIKVKDLPESINIQDNKAHKRKYYQANKNFVLYPELKALFAKSQLLLKKSLIKKIQDMGTIYLLVLTGFFTGINIAQTDILIVGRINRKKLKRLIRKFEKELGREIYYTIMSKDEFINRRDLTDRFVFNVLENRKIVLVNKLKLDE